MNDDALRTDYRRRSFSLLYWCAVKKLHSLTHSRYTMSRLLLVYASPFWELGISEDNNIKRLEAFVNFVRRPVRLNLCQDEEPTIAQLSCRRARRQTVLVDDESHPRHPLPSSEVPPRVTSTYNLIQRPHQDYDR